MSQLLDFALFIKNRHIEDNLSGEEEASIAAFKLAYKEEDYLTLEEYEATRK